MLEKKAPNRTLYEGSHIGRRYSGAVCTLQVEHTFLARFSPSIQQPRSDQPLASLTRTCSSELLAACTVVEPGRCSSKVKLPVTASLGSVMHEEVCCPCHSLLTVSLPRGSPKRLWLDEIRLASFASTLLTTLRTGKTCAAGPEPTTVIGLQSRSRPPNGQFR